jgi:hypothetical protein
MAESSRCSQTLSNVRVGSQAEVLPAGAKGLLLGEEQTLPATLMVE